MRGLYSGFSGLTRKPFHVWKPNRLALLVNPLSFSPSLILWERTLWFIIERVGSLRSLPFGLRLGFHRTGGIAKIPGSQGERFALPLFAGGPFQYRAGGFACQGAVYSTPLPFALPGLPSLGTLSIAVKGCSESSGLGTPNPLGFSGPLRA